MPQNIRCFRWTCCLILLLISSSAFAEQPNIVVLFSDDAGYADFGFQPNVADDMKSLTPFIDTIARDGIRCSNAYMNGSVCSPSRAALMTGRYQSRFGFDNNLPPGEKNGLALSEIFGSKRLQSLGYKTALIGKWHLGYPDEFHPNHRGWDWFYGCLQGSRNYYPMENPSPHRVILDNETPTSEDGYVTDRIGDAACRFIEQEKDGPFYLFVSFTSPHGPLQPKKEDLSRLEHIKQQRRKDYAGLVVALDDNVGKILSTISAAGLDGKTLVIFTNDNGGQTLTGAINTPLRGHKGEFYEGGIRVPMAMRWPGNIAPGSVTDQPLAAIDFLPTFVQVAGGELDSDWKLDGVSLLPLLTGETKSLAPRTLFWRAGGENGKHAAREGKWKLVLNKSDRAQPEIYDLDNDISESKNLAGEHPEVVEHMMKDLNAWSSELVPPLWGSNRTKTETAGGKGVTTSEKVIQLDVELPPELKATGFSDPVEIETLAQLKRLVVDERMQKKIAKQINFKTQKILLFRWSGSGQDSLTASFDEDSDAESPVVLIKYQRGRTRDLRLHSAVFVVPGDATLVLASPETSR